jgi:hypothetical protein
MISACVLRKSRRYTCYANSFVFRNVEAERARLLSIVGAPKLRGLATPHRRPLVGE